MMRVLGLSWNPPVTPTYERHRSYDNKPDRATTKPFCLFVGILLQWIQITVGPKYNRDKNKNLTWTKGNISVTYVTVVPWRRERRRHVGWPTKLGSRQRDQSTLSVTKRANGHWYAIIASLSNPNSRTWIPLGSVPFRLEEAQCGVTSSQRGLSDI